MKVSKLKNQGTTDWTDAIYKNSLEKTASINVTAGKVNCPLSSGSTSTLSCETCKHCSGIGMKIASSQEYVSCSYKYDTMDFKETDSMNKFVSDSNEPDSSELTPEDFKSIFAKSERKLELDEDLLSHTISKSGNEVEPGSGTANFNPQNSNSIFDSSALDKFAEAQLAEENKHNAEVAKIKAQKEANKHAWDKEHAEQLAEINYNPKGIQSIAHEVGASNPEVADHNFSIFENIDEKLKLMPEFTEGEKFKSEAQERNASISRDEKNNDWEKADKKNVTTKGLVSNFFDSLFNEKGE